jgi:small-conductance mechanosensitive channel
MYHPLLDNLEELSMDQLAEKLNDVNSKISYAYRIGNYQMLQQLQLIQQAIQDKYNEKTKKQLESLNKKTSNSNNDSLDIG